MRRGDAFTPEGPLTLGDIREIAYTAKGDDSQIVEVRTPMGPDRRQVTLTVTDQRWHPPNAAAPQQDTTTEGETQHG
ncbi:uncharacterized protein RMCC_1345 [Mycolicibacterium canariasense]|uniref:Uncharacterized protein n=1 Tax=Mycolicibacterium canariasense TaxID=228230 RepID=A0A100W9R3_MYCCR|nr:hypothetical protein [Mycolicibacterium canariasense]MCV7208833.1 hypothetical protein [Mycolicibacterium canariasense]ORV07104.1 hypothetical protein AWB94_13965 [Mycolicibacterium canariasense]GAS94379.1 uncharacterized protein RMCC_1345 [Mycolicibacterium canariasense]